MADLPEVRLAPTESEPASWPGSKLGGRPDWLQDDELRYECCGRPMTFLGQIDTRDIPQARMPDSAVVYVFYCPRCFHVAAGLQCM